MSRVRSLLLIAFLAGMPERAAAQAMQSSSQPEVSVLRRLGDRNEIALDVGVLAGGLSYARRLRESRWSVGAGVWGAWEPPTSFDHDVWEPIGVVVFGRHRPASWLHIDAGLTAARYLWADDCSDCSGTFVGVRSSALAGYRFVFVGPDVSFGRASDDRNGADFGAIWGVQVRLIYRWGS